MGSFWIACGGGEASTAGSDAGSDSGSGTTTGTTTATITGTTTAATTGTTTTTTTGATTATTTGTTTGTTTAITTGTEAGTSSGSGDSGGSEAGSDSSEDANADGPTSSTGGEAGSVGDIDEIYEAAEIPPNQIFGFAQKTGCSPKCATPLTVGTNCCAGTSQVTWIVSANGNAHPAGWMQFNAISAPADASYDVTFWYHSGNADYWGDCDCGGQAFTQPNQGGCRPQIFTVNGTVMPGAYHFPAFPGSWATLYAATVRIPLKAGMNTILVAPPPPRDSVDLDAIEILPPGKGHAPLIAPDTADPGGMCPP